MGGDRGDEHDDDTRLGILTFYLTTAIAAALLGLILAASDWPVLQADIVPSGDVAADMLLVERAGRDWLLVGHYSRFGFNHPGPFFLSLRHVAERLAGGFLPGPYNAQLLAVLGGAALFVGLAAATAAGLAGGAWPGVAAAMATLSAVLLQARHGAMLSDAWMPSVLVAPFFAFVLLLAETARGRVRLLPPVTFCGGALAHGYVPLLPIVGVAWPLAVALGLRRYRCRHPDGRALPAWPIAASVGIIVLFSAPPVLDALLHPPGNVARILAVARGTPPGDGRSLRAAAGFVAQYWTGIDPIVAAAGVLGALLAARERQSRQRLGYAAGVVAVITALMLVVAERAPGELYPFIGRFYLGAPLALAVAAIAAGLPVAMRAPVARTCVCVGIALLLAATSLLGEFNDAYVGDPSLRPLTEAILRDLRAHPAARARLRFAEHDSWDAAAGLLVDLARFDQDACVDAPGWEVLFTPERICPGATGARRYDIVAAGSCADGCLARSETIGIAVVPATS